MKLFVSSLLVTRILYPAKSRKNSQTLEYQKEYTDPGISERMHRPWNIRKKSDPGISERMHTP
jgi:hypothetical protein